MSEWNNYTYNSSEYMNPNTNTQNGQYYNQNSGANYYPNQEFASNDQYVSFNEFISQIQTNGGANQAQAGSSNYNNAQYQNYPANQYNYENMPSSSQQVADQFTYGHDSSSTQGNDANIQYSAAPSSQVNNSYNNDAVFTSNLTPTALEFVPKSSQQYSNQEPVAKSNSKPQQNGSKKQPSYVNESTNRARNEPSRNDTAEQNSDQARPYYESNKNQRKQNHKGNVKDNDGRTFYNSSVSKTSQDVRNGGRHSECSNNRNRNWAGSQRVRPLDRNVTDDEQFANNYLQFKDDKTDKISKAHSSPMRNKNKGSSDQHGNKEMTQRERLSEQLDKGTLECLVCCERVKQIDPVWSCSNCYHVFHLRCIRKWAMSSLKDGKWRCPACQNMSSEVPMEYRCMCGAVRQPEPQRGVAGAHTCGQGCGRKRPCPHPCALLCHPGPCPPCQATIYKPCGCGAETRSVQCSSKLIQVCSRTCGKVLTCGIHYCVKTCHEGPCDDCNEIVNQECYCPARKQRSVPCAADTARLQCFPCADTCGRVLACGAHVCRARCHPPPCPPCALLPERVRVCPCGHTRIEENQRKLCTDPIPLCDNICAKPLACGPDGDKHFCKSQCHHGECPVCPDKTVLQCRCGHTSREVPCSELPEMLDNIFCQKKCNKKLSCGRHRCRVTCCASAQHRCQATCGRVLSCQTHRCEDLCHMGHCAPCPQLGWSEVRCACGAAVSLPPVRCGARPPACTRQCGIERSCGHPPHHSCHAGDCPPCVVLTAKRCHGGHEERKTILCSQEEFSCGLPCGKPLACGKHNCIKTCHKGPCDTEKCTQPCEEKRAWCGHPCGAPCHSGAGGSCPSGAPCRRLVTATCPCRRREQQRACADNARDLAKISSTLAATKIIEGGTVDLSDMTRPGNNLKTLECDDECRVEMRTRQMALALQIRNPDVSSKLAPRYSEHVRSWATRDSVFANHVHDKLTNLVQLAKKSKQKTRSHSFPSMNWQKRQFIHEMCEHFGCESVAYDAEPNRNVVATADKEKSWLPAMSVMEVLGREAGKRRVPPPVLRAPAPAAALANRAPAHSAPADKSPGGWAKLTSTNAWASRSQPQAGSSESKPPVIDYFDNPPDN